MRQLKPSEKALVASVVFGIALALGTAWLLPDAHWGVYVGVGVFGLIFGFQGALEGAAQRKQADQGHD